MHNIYFLVLFVFWFVLKNVNADKNNILITNNSTSSNQSFVKIPCNLLQKLNLERPSLKWFFGESEIIPDNKVYKVNTRCKYKNYRANAFNKISKIFHRPKI